MSDETPTEYVWDPKPHAFANLEPGVLPGYLVLWNGKPGAAQVCSAAGLVDTDGSIHFEASSGFRDCTIVDDREDQDSDPT